MGVQLSTLNEPPEEGFVKLSTRSRYGLRALIDIAEQPGDRPVMLRGISERQKISAKYLERLLADLRRAGIVTSHRGAGGGFHLSRPPADINLLDVVEALEKSFGTTDCVSEPKVCRQSATCPTRRIWARVSKAMWDALRSMTLEDARSGLEDPPAPDTA